MSAQQPAAGGWARFRAWRRQRPFLGGALLILGGVEMFFSGQLDLKNIRLQVGIEGLQATIIPVALVVLGALIIATPAHRVLYGVIALALSVYSLIGVNLGGFMVGFLLSVIGGVIVVAWLPGRLTRRERTRAPANADLAAPKLPIAAPDRSHAEYVRTVGVVAHEVVDHRTEVAPKRRHARTGAAVVAILATALASASLTAIAPQRADASAPTLCVPLLMDCSSPTPTPTPTPSESAAPSPTETSAPLVPGLPDISGGGTTTPTPTAQTTDPTAPSDDSAGGTPIDPADANIDPDAPIVTLPAAQLGGTSLSFTGIPTLSFVKLRLANGTTTTALKLTAASVTMDGFYLDVKAHERGTALATIDDKMVLQGHVKVYLNSVTAAGADGKSIQIGTDTPTVENELPAQSFRVTLGLLAVTADSITHTNTHQQIHNGD